MQPPQPKSLKVHTRAGRKQKGGRIFYINQMSHCRIQICMFVPSLPEKVQAQWERKYMICGLDIEDWLMHTTSVSRCFPAYAKYTKTINIKRKYNGGVDCSREGIV